MDKVNRKASRACVLLMDSLGVGESHDAKAYGDEGANTLGHILEAVGRPLSLPNLTARGMMHVLEASATSSFCDVSSLPEPTSYYGYAVEQSMGKDTPSGHWELAGVPVRFEWGYFPDTKPCFPSELIAKLIAQSDIEGILGNKHASGTEIIAELGEMHQQTGHPIVYSSADSVIQIAAHEESFGLDRLYALCELARELVDEYQIGRVIARPFVGKPNAYTRTANRRDYSIPPPDKTLLEVLKEAGREVIAIGKTSDIFAHIGPTQVIKAGGNMALFDATIEAMQTAPEGSLIFTNFVDFDSSYGHRRNVQGYAEALEAFDARMPELDAVLRPDDAVLISADHGCDPTFPGSNHTREHVPVIVYGPKFASKNIGERDTFADMGMSLAHHLGVEAESVHLEGVSFL